MRFKHRKTMQITERFFLTRIRQLPDCPQTYLRKKLYALYRAEEVEIHPPAQLLTDQVLCTVEWKVVMRTSIHLIQDVQAM